MTDRDEVAELADRVHDRLRRGEDPEFEFEIEFTGLTMAEQDDFMALMGQRIGHGEEVLETIEANVRVLQALFVLLASSGAPSDMGYGGPLQGGYISVTDVVESIRGAVPDPLAQ